MIFYKLFNVQRQGKITSNTKKSVYKVHKITGVIKKSTKT